MDNPSLIQRIRQPGAVVDWMIAHSEAFDGMFVLILFDVRFAGGFFSPFRFFSTCIEEHWKSIEEIEGELKPNTGLRYSRRTIPDSTDSHPKFNGFQSRIQRIRIPKSTDKIRRLVVRGDSCFRPNS